MSVTKPKKKKKPANEKRPRGESDFERRCRSSQERLWQQQWLIEWTLDRVADGELPLSKEQAAALRAEFPDLDKRHAGKRVSAARQHCKAVIGDRKQHLKAAASAFFEWLRGECLVPERVGIIHHQGKIMFEKWERDFGGAQRAADSLVKLFGLAEADKLEIGGDIAAALADKWAVKVSDDGLENTDFSR